MIKSNDMGFAYMDVLMGNLQCFVCFSSSYDVMEYLPCYSFYCTIFRLVSEALGFSDQACL